MNGCDRIADLLTAYLDGELSAGERELVDAHLPGCPSCRAQAQALRRALGTLTSLRPIEPTPGFEAAVLASLPRNPRRPHWARRAALVFLAGGAAAAALFVALPRRAAPTSAELAELGTAANLELFENYDAVLVSDVLKGAEDVAVVAELDQLVPPQPAPLPPQPGDRR